MAYFGGVCPTAKIQSTKIIFVQNKIQVLRYTRGRHAQTTLLLCLVVEVDSSLLHSSSSPIFASHMY